MQLSNVVLNSFSMRGINDSMESMSIFEMTLYLPAPLCRLNFLIAAIIYNIIISLFTSSISFNSFSNALFDF